MNKQIIFTTVTIIGTIGVAVVASRDTIKAYKVLQEKEIEYGRELELKERVRECWKSYLPTCGLVIGIGGVIIGGHSYNNQILHTSVAATAITNEAFELYKSKVRENLGQKKEEAIRDEIAKDTLAKYATKEVIITGTGQMLFIESTSGRPFRSTVEEVRKVINDLNKEMRSSNIITLNELYYALGLDNTPLGNRLGWSIDNDYIEEDFSTQIFKSEPCMVLGFAKLPTAIKY